MKRNHRGEKTKKLISANYYHQIWLISAADSCGVKTQLKRLHTSKLNMKNTLL